MYLLYIIPFQVFSDIIIHSIGCSNCHYEWWLIFFLNKMNGSYRCSSDTLNFKFINVFRVCMCAYVCMQGLLQSSVISTKNVYLRPFCCCITVMNTTSLHQWGAQEYARIHYHILYNFRDHHSSHWTIYWWNENHFHFHRLYYGQCLVRQMCYFIARKDSDDSTITGLHEAPGQWLVHCWAAVSGRTMDERQSSGRTGHISKVN